MKLPVAMTALCLIAAAASASPFVLEELVREGDVLPGLAAPVFTIGAPSINSSGQWAIPVSSPSPSQPTFQSGVLGNHGFRVQPGYDPDGSASTVRTRYDSAYIRDDGTMALVTQRLLGGSPSELWLGDRMVTTSPGAPFNNVSVLNDDTVIGSISTGAGGFNVLAEPNGQGGWSSGLVHGFGTQIPVGSVLLAPANRNAYARSDGGRQAWLGRIDPNGNRGEPVWAIAVDDEFVAVTGQSSTIPDYTYKVSGNSIAMQADGDLFFSSTLEWTGDGPGSIQNGIFREDGSPVLTTLDDIGGLDDLGVWGIRGDSLRVDETDNILWVAKAAVGPGPGDPFGVTRTALMYNDLVIAQTGHLLPDGSILLGPTEDLALSANGQWAIATLWVRDPVFGEQNAVYRFAIPTPGAATLGLIAGLAATRRRR